MASVLEVKVSAPSVDFNDAPLASSTLLALRTKSFVLTSSEAAAVMLSVAVTFIESEANAYRLVRSMSFDVIAIVFALKVIGEPFVVRASFTVPSSEWTVMSLFSETTTAS